MEEMLKKPHRHHVKEIPLAPVLDLLVVVIFFLVLSVSFLEFNKQSLPPAGVSTITDPVAPPPLAPKFFAVKNGNQIRMLLRWAGEKAGMDTKTVQLSNPEDLDQIEVTARLLTENFKKTYPAEKSIQLGLGKRMNYQELISIMDGIRSSGNDVVLLSYDETEAIAAGLSQ